MKKELEALLFILVIGIVLFMVRFSFANNKRDEHKYSYAEDINIVEDETFPPIKEEKKPEKEDEEEIESEEEEEDDEITSDSTEDNNSDADDGDENDNGESGNGNDGGTGSGGDGEGEGGFPTAVETPTPAPTPSPVETPTPSPAKTPKVTEIPDELVGIKCSWSDSEKVVYGQSVDKSKIKVLAEYDSGRTEEVKLSDCEISGLSTRLSGKYKMKISYKGFDSTLTYVVNNYVTGIEVDWNDDEDAKKLCKGDNISSLITVTANYADESEDDGVVDLEPGEFVVSGVDNKKTGVTQKFTVKYTALNKNLEEETFSSGQITCMFNERTLYDKYYFYSDKDRKDKMGEYTETTEDMKEGVEITSKGVGSTIEYKGDTYELFEEVFTVDSEKTKLPCKTKKRKFIYNRYLYYVLK